MPDYDGYAAAITVREGVLRTALQASYANAANSAHQLTKNLVDLSHSGATITPDPWLFLGEPDVRCDGTLAVPGGMSPGAIVITMPMWGPVSVTIGGQTASVGLSGTAEIAIAPSFTHGKNMDGTNNSNIAMATSSAVMVPSWTAVVTSAGVPAATADLLTGDGMRQTLETTISNAVSVGLLKLPEIPAGFLIDLPAAASSFEPRVRDGALLIGVGFGSGFGVRSFFGNADNLADFAGSNDLAGVVNPAATDLMFTGVHDALASGAQNNGGSLDSFAVTPQAGYFDCTGSISDSDGTLNFSFRLVPSMFHSREGNYFSYLPKPRWVKGRTWPALEFGIEDVQSDVDRGWKVILEEGLSLLVGGAFGLAAAEIYTEAKIDSVVNTFNNSVTEQRPGAPAARVQKTVPRPGGVSVRIGLDQFDVTDEAVRVGLSVRPKPSAATLHGPSTVPKTYVNDTLRYILRPPSNVDPFDPALRVHWIVEDLDAATTLSDSDGPALNRFQVDYIPASTVATNVRVSSRLYRQLGAMTTDVANCSVNVQIRPALPPQAYIRWQWQAKVPQISLNATDETWHYNGEKRVDRASSWHRTDAPCNTAFARSRYRYNFETPDRLPFNLALLEDHRSELCSYCFYGGPAGINARL